MPRTWLVMLRGGVHNKTYDERRKTECDYDDRFIRNISIVGER